MLLREVISQSVIISYKEDVAKLSSALEAEGLNPIIQRAHYTDTELAFSKASRCFLGHRNAWIKASENSGYTLICEADFVPCRGIGHFPTFWPLNNEMAWGYLYQGSPRIFWVSKEGLLRGHAAPTVAYIVNAFVANLLLQFFDDQVKSYRLEDYFTFEAHLQWWVMGRGAEAYIPMYHYGEHGGRANSEHKSNGIRRAGVHRADNLRASLAFPPQYASSRFAYFSERALGVAYGWGRLVTGRWIADTDAYNCSFRERFEMYMLGLRRLLPWPRHS